MAAMDLYNNQLGRQIAVDNRHASPEELQRRRCPRARPRNAAHRRAAGQSAAKHHRALDRARIAVEADQ
jgi:hypothetical protein